MTLESPSLVVPMTAAAFFAVFHSGSRLEDVAAATGLTLAVAFVLELAVVLPLAKLWNLSIDEEPRPREDFCPRSTDLT